MTDSGAFSEDGGHERRPRQPQNSLTQQQVVTISENVDLINSAIEKYRGQSMGYRVYSPYLCSGEAFGEVEFATSDSQKIVQDEIGSDGAFFGGYHVSSCISMIYDDMTGKILHAELLDASKIDDDFGSDVGDGADILHIAFTLQEARFGVDDGTYDVFPQIIQKPDRLNVIPFNRDCVGVKLNEEEVSQTVIIRSLGECANNLLSLGE